MSAPSSRIEHVSIHQINDHDADESYQVELLHLANGEWVAYRIIPTEPRGFAFAPAKASLVEALAARVEAALADQR